MFNFRAIYHCELYILFINKSLILYDNLFFTLYIRGMEIDLSFLHIEQNLKFNPNTKIPVPLEIEEKEIDVAKNVFF